MATTTSTATASSTAAAAATASMMLTPPNKRLAKRSILGTRVAVRGDDGKFYAGMIQATKTCEEDESSAGSCGGSARAARSEAAGTSAMAAENRYNVRLDTTRKVKEFAESEIVGPGFGSVAGNKLCAGQIVYVTHMNREVQGAVLHHGKESVVIQLLVSTCIDIPINIHPWVLNENDFFTSSPRPNTSILACVCVVLLRLSNATETDLSNKITRNRVAFSFKDSPGLENH